jgi:hypothetical protein
VLTLCASARGDELFVACHLGTAVAATEVRDVYLGERQISNGIKLVPVDNLAAQSAFLGRVLRMDADKYSNAWVRKSFGDGINPPVVEVNDAAVLEFVRRTPGACGYLTAQPDASVVLIATY